MKAYQIFGIGALALATLAGCDPSTRQVGVVESSYSGQTGATWIEGRPISCAANTSKYGSDAAILLEYNGKPILAEVDCNGTGDCSNVEAIVNGEIARGNDGLVKLHGTHKEHGKFTVDTVIASGYEIKY